MAPEKVILRTVSLCDEVKKGSALSLLHTYFATKKKCIVSTTYHLPIGTSAI